MQPYTNSGPINCNIDFSKDNVKSKTAIVTGGANGIGETYTRQLVENGAHVVIADISESAGSMLHKEFPSLTTFVKCDVNNWTDQLAAFKRAKEVSPSGQIDIVVANAGISAPDDILNNDFEKEEPEEPSFGTLDVNVTGVCLTTKLALWYFGKQHALLQKQGKDADLDQCLVLQGSLAGYVDLVAPQ